MSQYHHGDLRNALIVAAAEIIEQRGCGDFSMIDASRRAGVSSAAPYRHFKDRDALLVAVCQVAFMALTEATDTAARALTLGTQEHIVALGKAYIKFVINHPEFYDLMWGDYGFEATPTDAAELKSSGFYILVESIQAWCDKANLNGRDPAALATQLWATVHGLSGLALNKHLEIFIPQVDVYSLLESSTETFLAGLLSSR